MKGSEIAILVLSIIALILALVRVLPANMDLYASPTSSPSPSPTAQSQIVSCQSNGYTSGCVFSAIDSGNQYDNPSYCG